MSDGSAVRRMTSRVVRSARAGTPILVSSALGAVLALTALTGCDASDGGDSSAPASIVSPPSTTPLPGAPPPVTTDGDRTGFPEPTDVSVPLDLVDEEQLRICEEQASTAIGELITDYPRRLENNETGDVIATIILNRPADVSVEPPDTGTERATESFEGTSCEIRATLSSTDFIVEPAGPQSRTFLPAVDDDSFEEAPNVRWVWAIRSTGSGSDRMLYLNVEPIFVIQGRELPGDVAQLPFGIDVADAPDDRSTMERANDALKSLLTHPLFLLIVPGGGAAWLYTRIRRRLKPTKLPGNE